jgi:hypothetical protein
MTSVALHIHRNNKKKHDILELRYSDMSNGAMFRISEDKLIM